MKVDRIESHIIDVIDELVRLDPNFGKVICDVGANSEAPVADYFVRHHGFTAYLFEPQESCVSKLQERFKEKSEVTIIKAALGDNTGAMPLFESADGPGGECATLYNGNDPWQEIAVNKSKQKMIQVYRGDDLFEKYGIENIGVLKIDTEGFDYNVLKGINLNRFRPQIIITEEYLWNKDSTFRKYAYLDESNYVLLGFYEYNSVWVKKGFAGITSTKVAISGKSCFPEIYSITSKLHGLTQLLKRTERDESFSLSNIDIDIGVKDLQLQGSQYLITFFVFNRGEAALPCKAHKNEQLFVSYHLRDANGEMLSWDNARYPLKQDIGTKEIYYDSFFVNVPTNSRGFWIDIDIVDEGKGWYSAEKKFIPASVFIETEGK